MAQLKGKGSMTGVNLLVKAYDNGVTSNGKSQYADVSVDHRDPNGPGQTNLHLVSERVERDGKTTFNNGAPYSLAQFEALEAKAGPNSEPVFNKDGSKQIGRVFAVKADLMPASKGNGLVINTAKPIEQSDFKVDAKTLDEFHASMTAAKNDKKSKDAAAKEAKEAAPAAPAAEATIEQPAQADVPMFADASLEADAPSIG